MADLTLTPDVTYALVDGMGALDHPQYFWWKNVTSDRVWDDGDGVPANWKLTVAALDPMDPDGPWLHPDRTVDLTHQAVMKAVAGILSGLFSGPDGLPERCAPVGTGLIDLCWKLVADSENGYLSWDAASSDELIQVIMYGGVAFA